MKSLAKQYFEDFTEFKEAFDAELALYDIVILDNFLLNKENIERYYANYISNNTPKIALCGLNPGRFGAGLTGVPFIDYKSLSKILSNVDRDETEKSAQFIFKVIEKIGIERFYRNCYVTNISKFGYSKKSSSKNVNYPDLPERVQSWLYKKFIDEMNAIKPEIIIPLSKDVANTLQQMKNDNSLDIKIGERLNHPAWIMTYKKNEEDEWVEKYRLTILELFK